MAAWTRFISGIRALLRRERGERELDEELQSYVAASTAGTSAMLGWIYYPSHITFAGGATWKPREQGECFRTFRRDKNHPEMPVKPVTQYDSEGIDE